MSFYGYWYAPRNELQYDGRLIEPGELFRLRQSRRNDNKMEKVGLVMRFTNGSITRKCDNCGKSFMNENYWKLHRIKLCGRTISDLIPYELEEYRNPYINYLLGRSL